MIISPLVSEVLVPVSSLIRRVFEEHVAGLYPAEGCEEFYRFIEPAALLAGLGAGLVGWVAREDDVPVGVLVLRGPDHVSLFFVETAWQRRGVGRALMERAVANAASGGQAALTVNASPNAVAAYVSLGFLLAGPSQEKNGITFVPMTRPLEALRRATPDAGPESERLPGPPAVLVCGYEAPERELLRLFLGVVFVEPPVLRPVSAEAPERTVGEVLGAPEDPEAQGCGQLPRIVLLSGCTLEEARGVMDRWKASGLPRPIFAVSTAHNLAFRVRDLVAHLLEEQRVMREARQRASDVNP